jgi:hypothetical protein
MEQEKFCNNSIEDNIFSKNLNENIKKKSEIEKSEIEKSVIEKSEIEKLNILFKTISDIKKAEGYIEQLNILFDKIFSFSYEIKANTINIKLSQDNCMLYLQITDDYMYLSWLVSCSKMKGTQMLNNIILFCKKNNINKIELKDDSLIQAKCTDNSEGFLYNFAMYKIIKNGESWYNKNGFKSENYKQEIEHNKEIIKQTFNTIIKDRKFKEEFKNQFKDLNLDLPLDKIFQSIICLELTCKQTQVIASLLNNLDNSKIIKYNRKLKYENNDKPL